MKFVKTVSGNPLMVEVQDDILFPLADYSERDRILELLRRAPTFKPAMSSLWYGDTWTLCQSRCFEMRWVVPTFPQGVVMFE